MKKIMNKTLILLLLITIPNIAQKPIKTDLLPFFEKVVPPPITAKYAFEKTYSKTDEYGNIVCDSDKLFKPLKDQLEMFIKEINASTLQDNMPSQDQMDMAKQMQDPKFREKIKNMSKEEKMKWAMEMAKNNMPKATVETPEVVKAFKDASELTQATSNDVQKISSTYQIEIEHQKMLEQKHKEIDDWEIAEIDKLPNFSTGEMSYKDPKSVKAVKLKASDKHIAVVDEELKSIDTTWANLKTKYKTRCSPFNESLAKCRYGEDAKTKGWIQVFANAQQLIINNVIDLLTQSQKSFNDAAPYYTRKVKLDKEKVD
jgi:hypothetical protein